MLTKRRKQILDYYKKYIKENGYAPTLEEASRHFRLSSKSTIHKHLESLGTEGYLNKSNYRARAIQIKKDETVSNLATIPLLGTIAAGQPIEAIEDKEKIEVPKNLVSKSGENFALKVQGDSMIDEGIFDGDTVIIKKQETAENGETVVALLNGNEVTLKKIFKEKNGFRLQPANPNLKSIFTKELRIQGKVISVIRNFDGIKKEKSDLKNKNHGIIAITSKNKYNRIPIRIEGDIPVVLEPKKGDSFLFISKDQSSFTHALHKYPAKFFPELPRWIISKYSKEQEWILDPFTGSGTTNLEALLLKRNSVGIDIDPFSKMLARVKITPLDTKIIEKSATQLKRTIYNFSYNKVDKNKIPFFPYRDNWFKDFVLKELSYIKENIIQACSSLKDQFAYEDINNLMNFYLICFCSIIRTVSNADNHCTRTVVRKKLNKKISQFDTIKKFLSILEKNINSIKTFNEIFPTNIKTWIPENNDARNILFPENTFDLALTSPPYVNAVDYPRTHQLEIYWLGIENSSLAPLKKQHIGTESVSNGDYKDLHKLNIKKIDDVLYGLYLIDKRRSFILYKYLTDMELNLKEVYRVLKPGKKYIIVIGNNKMRGIIIENWKYLILIADRIGYKIKNYFSSEIINHFIKIPRTERINTDWVIILEK